MGRDDGDGNHDRPFVGEVVHDHPAENQPGAAPDAEG